MNPQAAELARKIAALSVEQRARLEARMRERLAAPASSAIPRRPDDGRPGVLSYAQERLWLTHQLHPDSPAYNVPLRMHLAGPLDVSALERALAEIERRHEALRTTFPLVDGRPVARVAAPQPARLPLSDVERDKLEAELWSEASRPFDLARGPLLRRRLLRLEEQEHVLVLVAHHIVIDGWSLGVFARELAALYGAFAQGRPSPLPEPSLQYADFAHWQRATLTGDELERQLAYWTARLAPPLPWLELPADVARQGGTDLRGGRHHFTWPTALATGVKELAQHEGATLFITLLAALQALLRRYTGAADVIVGTTVAGRRRIEVEPLIGLFMNNLVLRTDVSGDPSFRELVQRARRTAFEAQANQDVPFSLLVEHLKPARTGGHNPFFQVLFEVQNVPRPDFELRGLRVDLDSIGTGTAKTDLVLDMWEHSQGLSGVFVYSSELFEHETVVRMAAHLETLVTGVLADPGRRLSQLRLLPPSEEHLVLHAWNAAEVAPPALCAHQLVEAQVARTPDAPAVEQGAARLTFAELDRRAGRLARVLQVHGVAPDVRVGLCLPRSPEMVVGLLAILKSGGAFVPLDPTYPDERLRFIQRDAGVRALLVDGSTASRWEGFEGPLLRVGDSAWDNERPLSLTPSPANLAYVIYTSGSTGRPKGVAVEHAGLAHYLTWAAAAYEVDAGGGSLVQSTIAFDLTLTSVLLPLLAGGPVRLLPEQDTSSAMAALLAQGPAPGLVKITPAQLDLLDRLLPPGPPAGAPRWLVIGGEALRAETLARWRRSGRTRIVNEYGPTETVVGCCVYEVPAEGLLPASVPIGWPIARTRLYVLDRALNPVALGVTGELYIAGAGVARGYLGRPDLSAERFLPDPFSPLPGLRMYRTGDLARRRTGGGLEFLGRSDDQVKLRGFRIELDEVAAALAAHPAVAEAAAALRGDGAEPRLVAYCVMRDAGVGVPELRRHLQAHLPEYMVPSAFVKLEALPLTANGKLDRRALPPPDEARPELETSVTAPRDALETELVAMWEELLDLSPIGVHDNFFELGGHSLLAAELLARVTRRFGPTLPLSRFVARPTVEGLAAELHGVTAAPVSSLVALRAEGSRPRLFCVHPLSGETRCFEPLAARLGPDQPVFAFGDRPLTEVGDDYLSIGQLARAHVETLLALQPQGPYLLAGYSFGSILAFEMAQQLRQRQLTVALVGLLDGTSPLALQQADERDDVLPLAGLARDLARVAGREVSLPNDELRRLPRAEALERILTVLREAGLVAADTSRAWLESLARGLRTRVRAILDYAPQVYPGRLTLFRSTEVEAESAAAWREAGLDVQDRGRGWEPLSAEPLDIRPIPGRHATLLLEPGVTHLAEQLSAAIDVALHLGGSRA